MANLKIGFLLFLLNTVFVGFALGTMINMFITKIIPSMAMIIYLFIATIGFHSLLVLYGVSLMDKGEKVDDLSELR